MYVCPLLYVRMYDVPSIMYVCMLVYTLFSVFNYWRVAFLVVLQMAVRAVPYHKDFLALLGSDGTAEGNAAITVHMADFARSLGEINNIINQFYQSHGLDTSPLL